MLVGIGSEAGERRQNGGSNEGQRNQGKAGTAQISSDPTDSGVRRCAQFLDCDKNCRVTRALRHKCRCERHCSGRQNHPNTLFLREIFNCCDQRHLWNRACIGMQCLHVDTCRQRLMNAKQRARDAAKTEYRTAVAKNLGLDESGFDKRSNNVLDDDWTQTRCNLVHEGRHFQPQTQINWVQTSTETQQRGHHVGTNHVHAFPRVQPLRSIPRPFALSNNTRNRQAISQTSNSSLSRFFNGMVHPLLALTQQHAVVSFFVFGRDGRLWNTVLGKRP